MLQKTRGIVLHTINYAEASVIAHIYTEESGIQSFLLNGVRKPKARFSSNLLQPLTCVELVAYYRPGKTLHRVSEITALPQLNSIPYDTVKTTIALFLAEVMYRSIREEEKNKDLFDFIYNSVLYLDHSSENYHLFHLMFMLRLSRFLGFYPKKSPDATTGIFDLREGLFTDRLPDHPDVADPDTSALIAELLETGLESIGNIIILPSRRKKLLQSLVYYYELHQTHGFRLRSLQVLEDVLA